MFYIANFGAMLILVIFWADNYTNKTHHIVIEKKMLKQRTNITFESKTDVPEKNRHQFESLTHHLKIVVYLWRYFTSIKHRYESKIPTSVTLKEPMWYTVHKHQF